MPTAIDQIRELRALHQDGLLSGEEFERRKSAILDAAHARYVDLDPQAAGVASAAAPGTELGLMQGQQVGPAHRRYRLERLIASGTMGQVWQATDLATHAELGHSAQVALKILFPELTASSSHARLLVQEATRARRLAHEHIVRVYDWAQDPATASHFVIMECLEGEDLASLLAREGTLPLARVLALLAPVGAALDYAWDKHGLVHRDLKPANVFVTARGEVKLLDFGIAARARAATRPPPHLAPHLPPHLPHSPEVPARSGTPGYRAPEAGAPGSMPARSLDVYAVAAMVHQMLSGQAPGAADGYVRPAGLRDDQWQALRAGLAGDPAQRPESVGQLLGRLARPAAEPAGEGSLPDPAPPAPDTAPAAAGTQEPDAGEAQEPDAGEADPASRDQAAAAAARAAAVRLLREQERRARLAGEPARRQRREALREQLAARRAEEVAKAQAAQAAQDAAQQEAQRKAQLARAAAAYLAEQERARGQPTPPVPPAAQEAAPAPQLLRDRFRDGAGAGPELVLVKAGRFQMGSPEHERRIALAAGARSNWLARETPQRWVGIERPFALGRYPVTVGEWRAFAQASGWRPAGAVDWAAPGFAQDDSHPVVGVSWDDAQRYLAWLSERTGARYRLPSEAEWEYACRAGTRTAFSFGDAIDTGLANYDGNFAWNGGARGSCRGGTTPVTQFQANPWGLHDMHGNVWEWVQDRMHDDYAGAPCDGSAWEEGGDRVRRVLRGGCWLYRPHYLRSALRNAFSAVMSNDIVGFRVARDLPADGSAGDVS